MSDPLLRIVVEEPDDAFARGKAYAAGLGERLASTEAAYFQLFELWAGVSRPEALAFGAEVLEAVAGWRPELVREMEGVAAGGGCPVEVVAAINARTELVVGAECATVGRVGPAAPEGPWLAQNWDWYLDAPERCVGLVTAVGDVRFATFTEAGILGKIGVNSLGLALSLDILRHTSDRRGACAAPIHLLLREVLGTCATPDDVEALLASSAPGASSCLTVVTAKGQGAVFEVTPAGSARIEPDEHGLLAHTNHFVAPALVGGERLVDRHANSCTRMASVAAAAPTTLAAARAALSDGSDPTDPVCRPGSPDVNGVLPDVGTAALLLMDPAAGTVECGLGPAGRDGWSTLSL